jgi:hypothetical protein
VSCRGLVSGDSTPVAVQVVAPPDSLLIGDTVPIEVHVLNRSGDSIPGAPIALVSLNPDTIGIDSARQAVVGIAAGPGQVIAKTGSLPSQPFRIVVK